MEIYLNELSHGGQAHDRAAALRQMAELLQTVRSLAGVGIQRTLRTVRNFLQINLASDYPLSKWMNDDGVNRDERTFFKTIVAKSPYLEDVFQSLADKRQAELDCRCDGERAIGLGAAYLLDSPALSFGLIEAYRKDPLALRLHSLDESRGYVEEDVPVCNVHSPSQVDARKEWLAVRVRAELDIGRTVRNGNQLWDNRAARWSNLEFAPAIERIARAFHGSEPYFTHVVRHLDLIDKAAKEWTGDKFPLHGIQWSYESESTMNSPELAKMRDFQFADGKSRRCEPHSKLIGPHLRIHFLPDQMLKKAFIGYIGPHLKI